MASDFKPKSLTYALLEPQSHVSCAEGFLGAFKLRLPDLLQDGQNATKKTLHGVIFVTQDKESFNATLDLQIDACRWPLSS